MRKKEQDKKIERAWTVRILQSPLGEKRTLTSLHLFAVLRHVVRSDGPQELNVVITVVFSHLFTTGFVWSLETDRKSLSTLITVQWVG